jgi:tRNA nucleotidyltransferase/poly(A) polymerase
MGELQKEIASRRIIDHITKYDLYLDIIYRLYTKRYDVFITGGFIRDFLNTGKFSEDIDFVTNATPEEIKNIFPDRKYVSAGETFLVSFVDGVEIATYRRDVENTGRSSECVVEQATSLEEDLARRDFTINAIAFSPITGKFYDPYMGISDLYDRKINFIGDPYKRIDEDNDRIIRACRMVPVINGSFGLKTLLALKEKSYLIDSMKRLYPERIRIEILKAMKMRDASKFFDSLRLINGLKYIFGSLDNCFDKDGGPYHDETIYQHSMDAGDTIHPKYKLVKLATYLHDVGKVPCAAIDPKDYKLKFIGHEDEGSEIIHKELKDLRFSNYEIDFITGLISSHMNSFNKSMAKRGIRRFLSRLDKLNLDYRHWFRLFIADKHANRKSRDYTWGEIRQFLSKVKNICKNEHVFSPRDLDINGNDVMEILQIGSCKLVGKVLNTLLDVCIDNPECNNRDYLINYIKTNIKE